MSETILDILPAELKALALLVEDTPQGFASGNETIASAALSAAKFIFDLGAYTSNIRTTSRLILCSFGTGKHL